MVYFLLNGGDALSSFVGIIPSLVVLGIFENICLSLNHLG